MALSQKSLFLYGYTISALNNLLYFRAVALETPRTATLNLGSYSLTGIMEELKRAMELADPTRTYTITADRTLSGGLENRITISTSGTVLELLFATDSISTALAGVLGFTTTDKTGATTYTGSSTTGTALLTNLNGYNFLAPNYMPVVNGKLNIAASGVKETVVFNVQKYWQVEFKYIPAADVESSWLSLIDWMIRSRMLEMTPDYTEPATFYEGTLETPSLQFKMSEMLPNFPNVYQTGMMKFRQRLTS
jgi:hypothetical protein